MLIKLNDLSHFLTYGHTVLDQESCKMGCKGSKDPEPKDHEQKDTESMAVRHFGLCGANLRSAKIMGAICLLYSISYLMLWIIEVSQAEKAEIFHFLAITFYVISLNAYILLIVASTLILRGQSSTSSPIKVPISGAIECEANVEETGLSYSEGMLCAGGNGNGSCQVRKKPIFQKILSNYSGRQWRSPDSRWGSGRSCQSRWIWHLCQGDLILFIILVQHVSALTENVFDIYTEVAALMGWINETILSMGGMQACGLTLEATPTEGWFSS